MNTRFRATHARAALIALLALAAVSAYPATGTSSIASSPAPGAAALKIETVSHGRFHDLALYAPAASAPTRVVLLLSGQRGFDASGRTIAAALAADGALVAGIDVPALASSFAADGGDCAFADGDLENLSHFIQAYRHLPTYQPPLLVGYGTGATLAYAVLAQAPAHTFAGALTLGFCPTSSWHVPLCTGAGLRMKRAAGGLEVFPVADLADPWVSLQGEGNSCPSPTSDFSTQVKGAARAVLPARLDQTEAWLPGLRAATARLTARSMTHALPPPPEALSDLPLIEVAAKPTTKPPAAFALLLSGDGGWAGLDKEVAATLAAAGVPVIGLDSLRYFWSARTPAGLAADLDRIIRYYLAALGKQGVLLIGYSQGADVLPFALNRLPEATRARVTLTVLIGLTEHAQFEFHLSSWLSDANSGPSTVEEIARVREGRVLCVYGADETDSPCPKLDPARVELVKLAGGHHFNGDYTDLARQILGAPPP